MKRIYLLPLLALPALSSCGDETTGPNPHAWNLVGYVVDASGDSLSGAFVNIAYTVLVNGETTWVPESISLPFSTIEPDSFYLQIHDHLDRLVWDLRGGPNDGFPYWPGNDLSGCPAPDGPYRSNLTSFFPDSTATYESWIVVARPLGTRSLVADVETDAEGGFSIPIEFLPIWDTYSNDGMNFAFGTEIVLYAFRGDGSSQFARAAVDVSTRLDDPLVLAIPD